MPRKGKSQRRVKDWSRRLREQVDPSTMDAAESETLLPQRVKLPSWRTRPQGPPAADRPGQAEAPPEGPLSADRPKAQGMVIGLFPGGAQVCTDAKQVIQCSLAGTFRPPPGASALAVGDEVTIALSPASQAAGDLQADKQRTDGFILLRALRRTALSRPQPTSGKRRGVYDQHVFEKVIAANMEILLIVASVRQPRVRPALIERYCIIAERGELAPVVVINKIDLAAPEPELVEQFRGGSVGVHLCSAATGEGIESLGLALRGRRSILAGASGVGKSTLINALIPGTDLATAPVRAKDDRGRHVTAAATLHELPGGGILVDTPGVRELALEMEAAELPWYFPEFAALAGQCRFNNCSHTHEPDCAVIAAVEGGRISARRHDSYLRILETIRS